MATILDIEFSSDDSEYEDNSKDVEEEVVRAPKIKRNMTKVLNRLDDESRKRYSIPQVIDSNDFMLQFHKSYEPDPIDYSTSKLLEIMDKSSSRVCIDVNRDPSYYKYNENDQHKIKINEILDGVNSGRVKQVVTAYRFAGKVYNITQRVDENSREYKNYLKSKERQVGGGMSWLDMTVSGLDNKKNMSAILKSQKDWEQFTKKYKLEDKLKQGHKFIKQSNFLSRAEWLEHQVKLDKRLHDNKINN